ncbi:helix-turn-helix domain-containing protein [Paraburkholderia sp. BCC1885]|uniref:helix-turn-helix domain-containing protein n=1 Tax=Paraburkholderia sp. BCC1885 TaxID=2562669 RepID=UPI0011825835|nr:helix-turn-helix transcriptional regulator [Paraburkholderia sp. BCC1885]
MTIDSKPLTLLKAYRIANDLDANKICEMASISRSYLTRVEQGATPSAEIAARLIGVLSNADCVRMARRASSPTRVKSIERAKRLVERVKTLHAEFAQEGIREIHLLYPQRYQAGVDDRGCA